MQPMISWNVNECVYFNFKKQTWNTAAAHLKRWRKDKEYSCKLIG